MQAKSSFTMKGNGALLWAQAYAGSTGAPDWLLGRLYQFPVFKLNLYWGEEVVVWRKRSLMPNYLRTGTLS